MPLTGGMRALRLVLAEQHAEAIRTNRRVVDECGYAAGLHAWRRPPRVDARQAFGEAIPIVAAVDPDNLRGENKQSASFDSREGGAET